MLRLVSNAVAGATRAPLARAALARPQHRWYESESVDVKQLKKGDFVVIDGFVARVMLAETKAYGRSAAQGSLRCKPVNGPQRGDTLNLSGMKWNKVEVKKKTAMFDHVNEEKDVLVLQYYAKNQELKMEATGTMFELDGETFEGLVQDGEGTLKWLTAEMELQVYRVDEEIIEIKYPTTFDYTAVNVSQAGGKYLCLLDENDEQVYVETPNVRPGDKIQIALPTGRVLKKK